MQRALFHSRLRKLLNTGLLLTAPYPLGWREEEEEALALGEGVFLVNDVILLLLKYLKKPKGHLRDL